MLFLIAQTAQAMYFEPSPNAFWAGTNRFVYCYTPSEEDQLKALGRAYYSPGEAHTPLTATSSTQAIIQTEPQQDLTGRWYRTVGVLAMGQGPGNWDWTQAFHSDSGLLRLTSGEAVSLEAADIALCVE